MAETLDPFYFTVRRSAPLTIQYYDQWVARLLHDLPASTQILLELMAGGGEVVRRMRGRTCIAVDEQRDPMRGLPAVCADAACLPFAPQTVDAIVIMGGLHHAKPRLLDILADIARVLRPGGVLLASEPANDHPLIRRIRHWQYRHSRFQGHDPEEDGLTEIELRAALDKVGLRLDRYQVFGFVAYPLMGNADLFPWLPTFRSRTLGHALLGLDALLERLPLLRHLGWASLLRATKV